MATESSTATMISRVDMPQRNPATGQRVRNSHSQQPKSIQGLRSAVNETELLERLQTGDQGAFEAVFHRYSPKLYNVAHRILGEAADAQEVIQDVFLTLFRKAHTFQGNSQLSTWLYRLTVNAALGKIRSSKKKFEVSYEEHLPKFKDDGHHAKRPIADWSNTIEESFAHKELAALLSRALSELKPIDKTIVVLSDVDGLRDKEIASIVNLTVSAVKTRLHRARLVLRANLTVALGHTA